MTVAMGDISASSELEENIDHLLGPALYTFSVLYCMTVSLGDGGAGLGTAWAGRPPCGCLAAYYGCTTPLLRLH